MRLLLVDNFDSFTNNIVAAFERMGVEVLLGTEADSITHLVLGPGPGFPSVSHRALIHRYLGKIPILGICLGHQTIAAAFGGKVVRAKEPRHGKVEPISHDGKGLFQGLSSPTSVTRYHSLVVCDLPPCLEVTSESRDGEIMGLRHKDYLVEGVQFHPESIASNCGEIILRNFLSHSIDNHADCNKFSN